MQGASQLLLPGEGFECTAMYSITQEHADSGEVVNLATASAVSHDAQSSQVQLVLSNTNARDTYCFRLWFHGVVLVTVHGCSAAIFIGG